jgi:hypothetical protein
MYRASMALFLLCLGIATFGSVFRQVTSTVTPCTAL